MFRLLFYNCQKSTSGCHLAHSLCIYLALNKLLWWHDHIRSPVLAQWHLHVYVCLYISACFCKKRFGLLSQHLGLNAIEASEPEDLSAAQLSLSTVDFLLIFCQLLSFFLPWLQAKSRLLQAGQTLGWHRGNHLETECLPCNTVISNGLYCIYCKLPNQ